MSKFDNTRSRGFTLIEIMITVAIVAILASVAYASYTDSVQRSRRTDGQEALNRAAALQERWYIQNNQYSANMASLGGATSLEGNYALSAVNNSSSGTSCDSGACYTITATAQNAQAADTDCATLTIDNLGRKRSLSSASVDTSDICW